MGTGSKMLEVTLQCTSILFSGVRGGGGGGVQIVAILLVALGQSDALECGISFVMKNMAYQKHGKPLQRCKGYFVFFGCYSCFKVNSLHQDQSIN